jgi:aminoglycoside 3-N-acetyltransferase
VKAGNEDATAVRALAEQWSAAGVERGDTVLLHSSIKRTLLSCRRSGRPVSPRDILDSFLAALGPEGTLLLPLFNFDFAKGQPFDIRQTPSEMGALTEAGRVHSEAVRTGHPLYSFAVIGARSARFRGVDNVSGYAQDSPFGILLELNGTIAVLDLDDQNSMTFYHHVEEMKGVPYRYFKAFTGTYTGLDGVPTQRTYTLFVRDIDRGIVTDVNAAGEMLWERGLYRGDRPGIGSGLRTIRARAMFDVVAGLIDSGRAQGTLYSIKTT